MKDNMPKFMGFNIEDRRLAEAYVPDQPYGEKFPLNEALEKGTLFKNLYRPYVNVKKDKK